MEWNGAEIRMAAERAGRMAAWDGARRATVAAPSLTLRLSDARALREGLPPPVNPRAVIVRHLFRAMGFDECRLAQWRVEHKLVQALLVEQYCPGLFPITCGLERQLAGMTGAAARRWLSALNPAATIVKPALGEASGEAGHASRHALAHDDLAALVDGVEGHVTCPVSLSDERFVLQERVAIAKEIRVHSLEDRVVPDMTFRRYAPASTHLDEREAPNAFVQAILDRLPAALVKDTLYGWDVALDDGGRWRIIELNPSGFHPVFRPGFHCSGFLQTPAWGPPSMARLLRFVSQRHRVDAAIALDVDAPSEERAAYWLASHCQAVLDEAGLIESGRTGPLVEPDGLVLDRMAPSLSPWQNITAWTLRELQSASRRAAASARATPAVTR